VESRFEFLFVRFFTHGWAQCADDVIFEQIRRRGGAPVDDDMDPAEREWTRSMQQRATERQYAIA
jgi:hypothetical protein